MGDKKVLLVREWEIKGIAGEGMGDKPKWDTKSDCDDGGFGDMVILMGEGEHMVTLKGETGDTYKVIQVGKWETKGNADEGMEDIR